MNEKTFVEEDSCEFNTKEEFLEALSFLLSQLKDIQFISIRNGYFKELTETGEQQIPMSFFTIVKSGCVEIDG